MANYKQGDYMIGAYHFKNFVTTYPLSDKAEEALFMAAMCNDRLSPRYELDQTYTTKAIDGFQNFINQYPESKRLDTANAMITKLRKKLEKKRGPTLSNTIKLKTTKPPLYHLRTFSYSFLT
jgi:outer membrane protein assembly factor BamD